MLFDAPEVLLLLPLLAAVVGYVMVSGARRRRETGSILKAVVPAPGYFHTRLALAALFALAATVVAARPYVAYTKTADFLFVVDVSRSMQARFSCSEPTFLERGKRMIRQTVGALPEARFGIVAFDRFAFPVTQLTGDREYLVDVVDNGLYVGLMLEATQTEIANALSVVADKIERLPGVYGGVKHLVLLSDGHVSGAYARRFQEPLRRLGEAGVGISAVGIGNPQATPVLVADDGRCTGAPIEIDGERVLIPLRDDVLKHIATESGGGYYSEREPDRLVAALRAELEPALREDGSGGSRRDVGALFAGISALALLGFVYMPARFPGA
jgi:hypothetical protein